MKSIIASAFAITSIGSSETAIPISLPPIATPISRPTHSWFARSSAPTSSSFSLAVIRLTRVCPIRPEAPVTTTLSKSAIFMSLVLCYNVHNVRARVWQRSILR